MAKYIISCCNTGSLLSEFGLVILDSEITLEPFSYLDLHDTNLNFGTITGFTGICELPNGYAVATQSTPSGILILDTNLNFVNYIKLKKYYDLHSMIYHDDNKILVAATATNQILEINLASGREKIFWDADNVRNLHINTFQVNSDNFLVLSHQDPTHLANKQGVGVVLDVNRNKRVLTELWHPHDLFQRLDGSIAVLSSARGTIFSLDPTTFIVSMEKQLNGYIRGYFEDDDGIFVGVSALRMISRKQGAQLRYYKGSFEEYYQDPIYQSFIAKYTRHTDNIEYIPFTQMNFEIYEVKRLAEDSKPALVAKPEVKRHMILRWLLNMAENP